MIRAMVASALLVSNVGIEWLNSKFDTYDKIQKQRYGYNRYSKQIITKHYGD